MSPTWMFLCFIAIIPIISGAPTSGPDPDPDNDPTDQRSIAYWMERGRQFVQTKLDATRSTFGSDATKKRKKPKNLVFFLGDGMGINSVSLGRIYMASLDEASQAKLPHTNPLDEAALVFQSFPYTSIVQTFSDNTQAPDSAASGTAFTSGVRTNYNVAGVSGYVPEDNDSCAKSSDLRYQTESFIVWAQRENKSTGFITNTRVTHATPSTLYAHLSSRAWESNAPPGCLDVTSQLVHGDVGQKLHLILGGGAKTFAPVSQGGNRSDDQVLYRDWGLLDFEPTHPNVMFTDKADIDEFIAFDDMIKSNHNKILGLFNDDHMLYEMDRAVDDLEPSLADMTKAGTMFLKLKQPDEGFVLFIEGGKIDLAHHKNWGNRALHELAMFNEAVKTALEQVDLEETLVIVTADHSHGVTVSGYSQPGTDPLLQNQQDSYGVNFSAIQYATGIGHEDYRQVVDDQLLRNFTFSMYSGLYTDPIALHTAEDVPLYATGPSSFLFTGSYHQAMIPHLLSYALCMGPHKELCELDVEEEVTSPKWEDEGTTSESSMSQIPSTEEEETEESISTDYPSTSEMTDPPAQEIESTTSSKECTNASSREDGTSISISIIVSVPSKDPSSEAVVSSAGKISIDFNVHILITTLIISLILILIE